VIFGVAGLVALLGLKAPPSTDDAAQGRRVHTNRDDAEDADLLVDVRDDEPDVYVGPDGDIADGDVGADFGIT
jgi:hypothetical protein